MISSAPIDTRVRLPDGVLFPDAETLHNPLLRRIFTENAAARFLVRVEHVRLDEKQNARSAEVAYLDSRGEGPEWVSWSPGSERLCWNGFRIEFKDTPRAGLHLRLGLRLDSDPRGEDGYALSEPRFIAAAKLDRDGVYVLKPADIAVPWYRLDFDTIPEDPAETRLVLERLMTVHGATRAQAECILRGQRELGRSAALAWERFEFRARNDLERLRAKVKALAGTGRGILIVGNVSPLSHAGEICRLAQVPARFQPA